MWEADFCTRSGAVAVSLPSLMSILIVGGASPRRMMWHGFSYYCTRSGAVAAMNPRFATSSFPCMATRNALVVMLRGTTAFLDQFQLFSTTKFLYRRFTTTGTASRVSVFGVNDFHRLASTKVLGSTTLLSVLPEPPLKVGGNTRIKRVIAAPNDVDHPIHADRVRESACVYQ
jgi:hypothetical protein